MSYTEKMPLADAMAVAGDYINPRGHAKIHTYKEVRSAIETLMAYVKECCPELVQKDTDEGVRMSNYHVAACLQDWTAAAALRWNDFSADEKNFYRNLQNDAMNRFMDLYLEDEEEE